MKFNYNKLECEITLKYPNGIEAKHELALMLNEIAGVYCTSARALREIGNRDLVDAYLTKADIFAKAALRQTLEI